MDRRTVAAAFGLGAFVLAAAAASASRSAAWWSLAAPGSYPTVVLGAGLALLFLASLPLADRALARALRGLDRLPVAASVIGAAAILLLLAWVGRVRVPWLGDQVLWIRSLSFARDTGHLMEPGSYTLFMASREWLGRDPGGLVRGPAMLSVLLTVPYVVVARLLAGELVDRGAGRAWCWLLLLTGPQMLLFRGYVESYGVLVVALFAFAWLALRARRRSSWFGLAAAALAAVAAHLQAVALLPALAAAMRGRRDLLKAAAVAGLVIAGAATWYVVGGREFGGQKKAMTETLAFLFESTRSWDPFLGGNHLLGVLNALILFGGPMLAVAPAVPWTRVREETPHRAAFLALLVVPGIVGPVLIRLSLGALRDWDLFSGYLVFLTPLIAIAWLRLADRGLPRFSALLLVLGALHGAAWIHHDADPGRAFTRAERVYTSERVSPHARALTADVLAFLERDRDDHARAAFWYGVAAEADPANWRYFNNHGSELRRIGRTEEAETAFRTAVSHRPRHPDPFVGLGGLQVRRSAYAEALGTFTEGIAVAGPDSRLLYGRGVSLAGLGRFPAARAALDSCLALSPRNAEYLRTAAQAARDDGDPRGALGYLGRLAGVEPDNAEVWRLVSAYAAAVGDSALARRAAAQARGLGGP